MSTDRTTIATAVIGAALAGAICVARPDLVAPLGVAIAAFVALVAFLKL